MKLYVVRHGQSIYNTQGKLNDVPPGDYNGLTELGQAQAKTTAHELKGVEFDALFVSEFARTKETARIINEHHKLLPVIEPRINERKMGSEGKMFHEYLHQIKDDPFNITLPGGESFQDIKQRIANFLEELKTRDYENVLIVTHGQPVHVMYGYFNKLTDVEMYKNDKDDTIKNASVHVFDL